MTTLGSRYVQLLQGQPDPNNGTIYGGLASALQKGMMGYAMGQDRAEEEAKQGRLTQALQMMAGTPDNTITWNQPTRPDGTGDPTTTIPGQAPDRQGAIGLLLQDNPDLALQLMNSDYNFNRQQEAAAAQAGNELVTVVRNGVKVAIPRSQMQPGEQVDYTPTPEAPEIRPQMLPDDMVQDLQFNPLTGEYDIPVGEQYSRWRPVQVPQAEYVNFFNPTTNDTQTVNANDPAAVQALTSQGYAKAKALSIGGGSAATPYTDAGKATSDFRNGYITPEEYEKTKLSETGAGLSEDAFANADKLRDELNALSGDYLAVRDAYSRIGAAAQDPSPAGDLALIFNYMKILDPGSVVRESEFAQAAATGSYGEQIQAAVNRIGTGKRLTEVQRDDFVNRAKRLFEAQAGNYQANATTYTNLAKAFGLDPSLVVMDYGYTPTEVAPPTTPAAPALAGGAPQAFIDDGFAAEDWGTVSQSVRDQYNALAQQPGGG